MNRLTVEAPTRMRERRTPRTPASPTRGAIVASGWAVLGIVVLFAFAVLRLGARGITTVRAGLDAPEWLALIALTAVFVYGEGVRALQRRWVPWVIGRAALLRAEPRLRYRLLAPLHAMALIGAPARTLAKAWGGSAAIFLAVLIVSRFPEPWRGITDFAVAAALAWATVALILAGLRAGRA
jgi:hypothetical protein